LFNVRYLNNTKIEVDLSKKHTVSNPQDLIDDSIAIGCASNVLFTRFDEFLETQNLELFKSSFLGAVILNSFAIELSIKAIHAQGDSCEFPSGHKLQDLFDQLPIETKKDISDKFSTSTNGHCLNEFLKMHNTSFQDWRYIAESKNNDFEYNFSDSRKLLAILQS